MDYAHFSEEDFILDESFVDWFKQKNATNNAFWEAWVEAHPEKKATVENALHFLRQLQITSEVFTEEDTQQDWEKVQATLQRAERRPEQAETIRLPVWNRFRYWRGIAATVALLLLTGAVFFFLQIYQPRAEYATNYGETQKLTLPDGSVVTLNANSTLSFEKDWSNQYPREVWLKGEAFFCVVKKTGQGSAKFRVHTGNVQVEVLGTQFNVKERRGETEVVLNSGKIRLSSELLNRSNQLVMTPGELVTVSREKDTLVKKKVNPEMYSSWRRNVLIFEHTPLQQVASIIQDTYGLKAVFEDPTQASKVITGTIPANNVDVLLLALSKSLDLQISREEDTILFKKNTP